MFTVRAVPEFILRAGNLGLDSHTLLQSVHLGAFNHVRQLLDQHLPEETEAWPGAQDAPA